MRHYRLSTRNEIRKSLRPLGYESLRYSKERMKNARLYREYREQSHPLSVEEAKELFAQRNLTFTLTAGRTGTKFASALLNLVPSVLCEHEPYPCFTWLENRSPSNVRAFWLEMKLPMISRVEQSVYVETSHVFGKGYLEPLLDIGVAPGLLAIGRDPRLVAKSFLQKYTIPNRTWLGRQWLLDPMSADVLVKLDAGRRWSDYQLCYWYVLEMEARQKYWVDRAGAEGLSVIRLDVSQLHNYPFFLDFLQQIGTDLTAVDQSALGEQHLAESQKIFNKTTRQNLQLFTDIGEQEKEIWSAIDGEVSELHEWIDQRYSAV